MIVTSVVRFVSHLLDDAFVLPVSRQSSFVLRTFTHSRIQREEIKEVEEVAKGGYRCRFMRVDGGNMRVACVCVCVMCVWR